MNSCQNCPHRRSSYSLAHWHTLPELATKDKKSFDPGTAKLWRSEDKKVFSKRLARDFTVSNLNTEDYHVGASVAVPFTWESQPGTPKIMVRENPLPPLTPPPSYSYKNPKRAAKKFSKSNILDSIFPKCSTRKANLPVSPAASSSSSSSKLSSSWSATCSVPSSPARLSKSRGSYHGISSSSRRTNSF